jgi:hypothetical protein
MTTYTAAVTFEFEQAAPLTWRGEIFAAKPYTALGRACKAACRAYPHQHFTSLVVLLEKTAPDA